MTSTKPSSPTTYTFANGVLSPLPSNWSRSVPTNNGDPCYVTTAIAIGYGSDVTITSDAWSDPTILVENGAEGYSPTVSTGTSSDGSTTITVTNKDGSTTTELVDGTARDEALSATEATDALDTDFSDFKSNEYAQINDEVGGLVNYKESNEKEIANIKDELSQELVAKKFARIENGSLILGATDGTTAVLTNEQFGFYTPNSETPASYFGKDGDVWAFNIERGIVTNDLRFNGFQWISRANKNMSLKWLD